MKNLLLLFVLFIYTGCSPEIKDDYSGYIYNDGVPMKKIKIIENTDSRNYTYTDEKGFFYLKRANKDFVNELIIQDGIKTDTIYLAHKGGADGKLTFLFLTTKTDTLDLNLERIFKKQSSGN
ncbi:MAG: hypothetical protein ABIP95_05075 [Pelobium sp.]